MDIIDGSKLLDLPEGREGVIKTLDHMWHFIQKAKESPELQKKVRQIIHHIPERDKLAEAETLLSYVQNNIRYVMDPLDIEMITTPKTILTETLSGDCDDFDILLGAMLESIGIPIKLIVIQTPDKKNYNHVYLSAKINEQWMPIDPINESAYVGWEYPHYIRKGEFTKRRKKTGVGELSDFDLMKLQEILEKGGIGLYRASKILPKVPEMIEKGQEATEVTSILKRWGMNPLTWAMGFMILIFVVREIGRTKK